MHKFHTLLCGLILLGFAGCASMEQSRLAIPQPDSTPFESDTTARMIYLDAYRDGYRAGMARGPIPSRILSRPYRFAYDMGWHAGYAEAVARLNQGQ